uniref:ARA70 domain-containing protein n=1 Tax=Macrostomum lignano TaxID=282301 RepID=A0A1I8GSF6_9PLAT
MVDSERTRLYQAMSHLTSCRKSLEDNAEAVKASIRDSVAKQIAAMRSREQWLVQQVELVQADQVDQLRRALPAEDSDISADSPAASDASRAALISFTAESAAMHESISQYGRIVCGYAQSPSSFSSATPSLPGPVEEYDDKEDEGWEHKSLASGGGGGGGQSRLMMLQQEQQQQQGSYLVRLPRTPLKLGSASGCGSSSGSSLGGSGSGTAVNAAASLADSFEVLSAGSIDEDKTRWLINYVCKANEPCQSRSDCLCDGGCFQGLADEESSEAKIRQELEGSNDRWLNRCQPKSKQQLNHQQQQLLQLPLPMFQAPKPASQIQPESELKQKLQSMIVSQPTLSQEQKEQKPQQQQQPLSALLLDNWKNVELSKDSWLANSNGVDIAK